MAAEARMPHGQAPAAAGGARPQRWRRACRAARPRRRRAGARPRRRCAGRPWSWRRAGPASATRPWPWRRAGRHHLQRWRKPRRGLLQVGEGYRRWPTIFFALSDM
ncbi:hypothetical protein PVAP13_1KG472510 [Panicum virgatum]|uniref:Uncharacterized protein n=1 Tax=Panicum virgatum TaxID=38727 RepID=A0A8T0XV34_PANVG|nr:hypothetical protein PVAP13_1KG472510 [Panicum virgatum]